MIPWIVLGLVALFFWQFSPRGQRKWLRFSAFWGPLFGAIWRDVIDHPIRHTYRARKFRKELDGDA